MLPDPYPVQPWTAPCRGTVRLPGSKSLTNRALLVSALTSGRVRLTGALFSRDSRILVAGLQALGFRVLADEASESIQVEGEGGRIPQSRARLFVGNAGTAARFLTALVCLHPGGEFDFDGDEEMRRRPMGGLLEALESLGARFSFHDRPGRFPFTVRTAGLPPGHWQVDAGASSQMLSALMMVAPMTGGNVRLSAPGVRPAFVGMTAGLMRQFQAGIEGTPAKGYLVDGRQVYRVPDGGIFAVEPDASAASYFMALPLVVGGGVRLEGLSRDMLQGDIAFARILESLGLVVEEDPGGWTCRLGTIPPSDGMQFDFETFSDTFLTLAAIAPLLPFPVSISGIAHTRHQETDRIAAMATELIRLGVQVKEEPGSLTVHPLARDKRWDDPAIIRTYHDHRVAMSFAITGCSNRFGPQPWLGIADPACCGKTFPAFFSRLGELYRNSHDK